MISLVHERGEPSFRTPCRSPARWNAPSTPSSRRRETAVFGTPERWTLQRGVSRDVTEFSTPQRVTMMGREHTVVEFRTPQHPLVGSNNWGGASPMLSRNIPKQAMDTAYLKFNSLAGESDSDYDSDYGYDFHVRPTAARGEAVPPQRRRGWLSSILKWKPKSKGDKVLEGSELEIEKEKKKKKSWLPKSKPKPKKDSSSIRWPQSWH